MLAADDAPLTRTTGSSAIVYWAPTAPESADTWGRRSALTHLLKVERFPRTDARSPLEAGWGLPSVSSRCQFQSDDTTALRAIVPWTACGRRDLNRYEKSRSQRLEVPEEERLADARDTRRIGARIVRYDPRSYTRTRRRAGRASRQQSVRLVEELEADDQAGSECEESRDARRRCSPASSAAGGSPRGRTPSSRGALASAELGAPSTPASSAASFFWRRRERTRDPRARPGARNALGLPSQPSTLPAPVTRETRGCRGANHASRSPGRRSRCGGAGRRRPKLMAEILKRHRPENNRPVEPKEEGQTERFERHSGSRLHGPLTGRRRR